MGIVGNILEFFAHWHEYKKNSDFRSVADCMKLIESKGGNIELSRLLAIIRKFENEGMILRIGRKGPDPVYDATYVSQHAYPDYLEYGSYDFYYYGFPKIVRHFEKSVLPVVVTKTSGDLDIGTCFVTGGNQIMTAYHCIKNMALVKIIDPTGYAVKPTAIYQPDDNADMAIIELLNYNFSLVPQFRIQDGNILDNVLTMGYPPIAGFDAVLISDVTHVSAAMKFSTGKIVAEAAEVYDPQSYFLINARVKGGNSGGPIIDEMGYVTGMIVKAAVDLADQEKLDELAYGIAITGKRLSIFLNNVARKTGIIKVPFTITPGGFSTGNK